MERGAIRGISCLVGGLSSLLSPSENAKTLLSTNNLQPNNQQVMFSAEQTGVTRLLQSSSSCIALTFMVAFCFFVMDGRDSTLLSFTGAWWICCHQHLLQECTARHQLSSPVIWRRREATFDERGLCRSCDQNGSTNGQLYNKPAVWILHLPEKDLFLVVWYWGTPSLHASLWECHFTSNWRNSTRHLFCHDSIFLKYSRTANLNQEGSHRRRSVQNWKAG